MRISGSWTRPAPRTCSASGASSRHSSRNSPPSTRCTVWVIGGTPEPSSPRRRGSNSAINSRHESGMCKPGHRLRGDDGEMRLTLRAQIVLVALVLAVIPLVGYMHVKQMERLLRDGQDQALPATA